MILSLSELVIVPVPHGLRCRAYPSTRRGWETQNNHSGKEVLVRLGGEWFREPVGHFGQKGQFGSNFRLNLAFVETPSPISAIDAGGVHAGFAAKP